jgi:group I intron endonuclease
MLTVKPIICIEKSVRYNVVNFKLSSFNEQSAGNFIYLTKSGIGKGSSETACDPVFILRDILYNSKFINTDNIVHNIYIYKFLYKQKLSIMNIIIIVLIVLILFLSNLILINNDLLILNILPITIITNLNNLNYIRSYSKDLKGKKGIYSIYNKVNNKQYIGSSQNLYVRLLEHITGTKSNRALQKAIQKYGLENFEFYVYEYYLDNDPNKLINLETDYINKFDFDLLYNFKKLATSMLGYTHTEEAISKMKERFKEIENHPMFNKTHTQETKHLISKPGELNPMYAKKHTEETRLLMSLRKSKNIVALYDINNNLVKEFNNNVELANFLKIHKTTIGRYIKSGKIWNNQYYFKILN